VLDQRSRLKIKRGLVDKNGEGKARVKLGIQIGEIIRKKGETPKEIRKNKLATVRPKKWERRKL